MGKTYILSHGTLKLAMFEIDTSEAYPEVSKMVVLERNYEHLPLVMKPISNNIEMYAEYIGKGYAIIGETGRELVAKWLTDRTVPADRVAYEKYYNRSTNIVADILSMHAVSFNDCYWVKKEEEREIKWNSVKLFNNARVDRIDLIEEKVGRHGRYGKENRTLGGRLEKYWFNSDDKLMLAKRTNLNDEILNIREVIASKILSNQNISSSARYRYIYNHEKEIVGCRCNVLTSESRELVTAYELLFERNLLDRGRNSIQDLKECIRAYGANERVYKELQVMFIVDYLVTNRDRHLGNIGFIRNPKSLKIVDIAIYDNGSSSKMECEKPEGSLCTTINGIEKTEMEVIDEVEDLRLLNISKLPDNRWVRSQIYKSNHLSEGRKQFLYRMYLEKVKVISEMQKDRSKANLFNDFNMYSM